MLERELVLVIGRRALEGRVVTSALRWGSSPQRPGQPRPQGNSLLRQARWTWPDEAKSHPATGTETGTSALTKDNIGICYKSGLSRQGQSPQFLRRARRSDAPTEPFESKSALQQLPQQLPQQNKSISRSKSSTVPSRLRSQGHPPDLPPEN